MKERTWLHRASLLLSAHSVASFCLACAATVPLCAQHRQSVADSDYVSAVVQKIGSLVESKYVLPDMAKEYAAVFRARYASGAYNSFTDPGKFAEQVTADLVELSGDAHFSLRVVEASGLGPEALSPLHHPVRYSQLGQREHLGYFGLEWLEGDVGLLDLRRFYPLSESKHIIDAAMLFLASANAIIIDVRENGGGAGESLTYFCSYFMDYPTQLTSYYSREADFLEEFWTTAELAGLRRTDVPVFILIGERTFSAAEMFAYDMQVRNRATLVGDSTGGGASSVDLYRIDDLFEIYIPTERAINPVTDGNWEGSGVIPDVVVSSEAALDTALVLARAAAEQYGAPRKERMRSAVEQMQRLLANAERLYRAQRVSDAVLVLDSVFQVGEAAGLTNEFFLDVWAYNYDSSEEILYALLNKWTELFPESPTPWERLAAAYTSSDRKERAIECYQRVLALDPENPNAARLMDRLRK